jgi:ATP-dependent 26S proteasome regulatory subunit
MEERTSFLKFRLRRYSDVVSDVAKATDGCSVYELSRCVDNAELEMDVNENDDAMNAGRFVDLVKDAFLEIQSSKATRVKKEDVSVAFDDVGGLGEAKQALTEAFVWPSKYPKLFSR